VKPASGSVIGVSSDVIKKRKPLYLPKGEPKLKKQTLEVMKAKEDSLSPTREQPKKKKDR